MTETANLNQIAGINPEGNFPSAARAEEKENGPSFAEMLQNAFREVNEKQHQADEMTEKFVAGEEDNLHQLMIQTQEARLSMQFATQVTNKVVDSYQEMARMQI